MTKISLTKCREYELDLVYNAIGQNIEQLGGLEKYIDKGEVVLLKINLLMRRKPETATTTNPVYVQALAMHLIEYGAKVIIGDSPGGPFNKTILSSIYKYTGIEEVANNTGATLNFNCESFTKKNGNALFLKSLTMTDMLNDVTKVISCSKLKTHSMMTFTGAVKNMFGTIPGTKKAEYHFNMPSYDDFADSLIDICIASDPVLSFMDAIVGMEGDGPSAGSAKSIGLSIASTSPYHLDKVACSVINLDYNKVPTIKRSVDRGLCTDDLKDVELIGEKIEEYVIKDFEIPKIRKISFTANSPSLLKKTIDNQIQPKPVFDKDTCIKCGICKENCPAKVIDMDNDFPTVKLSGCIRCFCCQELCPKKAVNVKKPLFSKLFIRD